ncbi:hypothetical protein N7501_010523 [Penicillium viridicatum]|nr:hypothetical protein N7501_010523 [Penicillium viridicatum]
MTKTRDVSVMNPAGLFPAKLLHLERPLVLSLSNHLHSVRGSSGSDVPGHTATMSAKFFSG